MPQPAAATTTTSGQPMTRREQIELDELLGDIYRGIETLSDSNSKSVSGASGGYRGSTRSYDIVKTDSRNSNKSQQQQQAPARVIGRAHVREYELPESSSLVRSHKREVAALRQQQQQQGDPYGTSRRQTSTPQSSVRYGGAASHLTGAESDYQQHNRHQQPAQSLASFLNENPVGSATPDNKRRVRIADPPSRSGTYHDYDDDDYPQSQDYYNEASLSPSIANQRQKKHRTVAGGNKERVKYVNTNKFLYHQERNPDDEPLSNLGELERENVRIIDPNSVHDDNNNVDDDDDDVDGVTRVEYYHTSWLDRQLGRASKRRSSKELNERQVKEKAMIEELKRNLKNGAITLRQSLRGNKKSNKSKTPTTNDLFADDQFLDTPKRPANSYTTSTTAAAAEHYQFDKSKNKQQIIGDSPSKVISSGLATVPRNYNNRSTTRSTKPTTPTTTDNGKWQQTYSQTRSSATDQANKYQEPSSQFDSVYRNVNQPTAADSPYTTTSINAYSTADRTRHQQPAAEPMQTRDERQTNQARQPYANYLSTLPNRRAEQHQLLQTHYRGNLRDRTNTLPSPRPSPAPSGRTSAAIYGQPAPTTTTTIGQPTTADKMRFTGYSSNTKSNDYQCNVNQHSGAKSPIQQQLQASNTISGIPSATEVVRSALSRSGSQASLNQLNKTINLLPNSPPAPSPMTPTQQLRPASPSLSPSPTRNSANSHYTSKTLGHQPAASRQYLPGQVVLHGTRTIGRPPQPPTSTNQQAQQQQQKQQQSHQTYQQQQLQQQSVYANPHASFMQHRMEQQMKQPNRNVSSIREFNELDSLLRSLGHPGEPRRTGPAPPSQSQAQTYTQTQTQITPGYSIKPAQPSFGGYMPANQQAAPAPKSSAGDVYARVQRPPQQQQQYQPPGPGVVASPDQQAFTVDVTEKKFDENCRQRQREALSEFEPAIELVPSMEDYQNISRLNPVKNHYWYKPNMSRDRAIDLLKDKPQGTFIVRDSTSFHGAYGLAVRVSKLPKNVLASLRSSNADPSAEYIRHFLIEPTGSGVRLRGYANEPVFDSLPDLIYQHSLTELALPCKLIIPRADIEDPRFNQKQKHFFDEFVASKEQAKHQPYERTSPDGGYRKYPGDVYVHNEHRIIFQ